MRIILITLPFLAAAGCMSSPASRTPAASAPAAPFVVPMDPGQITCAQMANPSALMEGANWVMGQARAAGLAGRTSAIANETDAAARLQSACASSPSARLAEISRTILG